MRPGEDEAGCFRPRVRKGRGCGTSLNLSGNRGSRAKFSTMCGHLHFLLSLDFWAAFLDLFGLAVLMSQDVELLKSLYGITKKLPTLKHLEAIDVRLQRSIKRFQYDSLPLELDTRLDTFQGKDALVLVRLFPNIRDNAIPDEVDLCAHEVGISVATTEILVWVARKGTFTPLLAGPMTDAALSNELEKKRRNFTYTAGFALMAVSSALLLISIAIRNS